MNILLGFFIYLLRGEKEKIVLDIVFEMVFDINVSKRALSWEVTSLWH
jgi:hypothetical protein